jgi:hypothetical protein
VYCDLALFFGTFFEHIKVPNVNFHLYAVDYEKLLGTLGCSTKFHANGLLFDRIFVSNLADDERLGFEKTVRIFGPRLKSKQENPHATLLLLHTTALTNARAPKPNEFEDFHAAVHSVQANSTEEVAMSMFSMDEEFWQHEFGRPGSARRARVEWTKLFFMDRDGRWERYCEQEQLDAMALAVGLVTKQTNTITKKWRFGTEGLQDILSTCKHLLYDNILYSGLHGAEAYTEWVKA